MQTDNTTLHTCINRCFALASDANIPPAEQKKYFAYGDALRARLMTLLRAHFDDGTPEVRAANSSLKKVTKTLKDRLDGIEDAANTVGALGKLVSILDDLFKLPFTFV